MKTRAKHAALAMFAAASLAASARADGATEAAAQVLERRAMQDDYLATDFNKALDRLREAIAKCGTDRCSRRLCAALRRDLGVVYVAGLKDRQHGVAVFAEAQSIDPNIALDPDLTTEDVQRAWDAALERRRTQDAALERRRTQDAALERRRTQDTPPAPRKDAPPASGPSGDVVHTVPEEQLVRTPLPLYLEYIGNANIVKWVVRYRGSGMTDFKAIEMNKKGNGWSAILPCTDIELGAVSYFLQGFNVDDEIVATDGDRSLPLRVPIRGEIMSDPPRLPGEQPPRQCEAAPESRSGRGEVGDACKDDGECASNVCKDDHCTAPPTPPAPHRKWLGIWIGLELSFDYAYLPSATDVCRIRSDTTPVNDQGYYCTNQGGGSAAAGSDYPSRSDTTLTQAKSIVAGELDSVNSGAAPGNVRLVATFDYALSRNLLLGLHVGIAFGTYPGTAAVNEAKTSPLSPVHVEVRGTYVFGKDPLHRAGVAPYVAFGFGLAPWDTKVPGGVTVAQQDGNVLVDGWNIAGPGFVTLGIGGRYAITPRVAFLAGLRMNGAFGNGYPVMPSAGIEGGLMYGF